MFITKFINTEITISDRPVEFFKKYDHQHCFIMDSDPIENPSLLAGDNNDACFTAFDKDGDDRLSLAEFTQICRALFRNDKGHIYTMSADSLEQIFPVFDKNQDGYIDRDEFTFCWNSWIKTIVHPINAFLVVDVQNDFICGSLNISDFGSRQNGIEVVEPINKLNDTIEFDAGQKFFKFPMSWHDF
jgi:hypothetical protein